MNAKRALALLVALLVASPAAAQGPKTRASKSIKVTKAVATLKPKQDDKDKLRSSARARVAFAKAGELRPAREVIGRREEPLTLEEDIAKQIEKLLRGPLRRGITGLFVADARTGVWNDTVRACMGQRP